MGYTQYFTGLPEAVVVVHMLGASLLTLTVTGVVVAVTGTPAARDVAFAASAAARPGGSGPAVRAGEAG